MLKFSFDSFDGAQFMRALNMGLARAADATAKATTRDLADRIGKRLTPDGESQQPNKPRTARRKLAKYGHDIPLKAELSTFTKPGNYRIEKSGSGITTQYRVFMPADREHIAPYLEKMGYKFFGISAEVVEFAERFLSAEIADLRAALDNSVKKGKP